MSKLFSSFFTCHELGEGVYAVIIKGGEGAVGNTGFVDLGDATVVFDTFLIPEAALDLKEIAEEITGNKVKYVVNSHYHGDHVNGNQVFTEAVFLSTNQTRQKIAETHSQRDTNRIHEEASRYFEQLQEKIENAQSEHTRLDFEWELRDKQKFISSVDKIIPTIPTILFDKKITIHGSKRSIELHHMGGGHTVSDTIMYLPIEQIMFTGDLVFANNHAWMGHGDPKEWLSILDKLCDFEITQLVPGHGPVGKKEHIDIVGEYIRDMIDLVTTSKNDNNPIEEVLKTPIPLKYTDWNGSPVYQWNVNFLYEYIKG